MRVIVTRVQPQADQWVQSLSCRYRAVALPLIETHPLDNTQALTDAWQRGGDYDAMMFVSGHAVDYFFASKPDSFHIFIESSAIKTRAWATGPGTRSALLAHGVLPDALDSPPMDQAQFDSETLWLQVRHQIKPGNRVLIVRGDSREAGATGLVDDGSGGVPGVGRDWLAQQLDAAGALVDYVVAYRRGAPNWSAKELSLATQASADDSVWVFSSAEALVHLRALLPAADWRQARAVATHARIVAAARDLGFGVVLESRPTLPCVSSSIESLT